MFWRRRSAIFFLLYFSIVLTTIETNYFSSFRSLSLMLFLFVSTFLFSFLGRSDPFSLFSISSSLPPNKKEKELRHISTSLERNSKTQRAFFFRALWRPSYYLFFFICLPTSELFYFRVTTSRRRQFEFQILPGNFLLVDMSNNPSTYLRRRIKR